MDAALKKILKPVTLALRHLLEGEYDAEGRWHAGDLEQRLAAIGVRRDRAPVPVDELTHLPAEDRHARKIVDAYLKLREEACVERTEAVAEFIRETAYTWANRLIALRCMEARELIDSIILQQEVYGGRSLEHHRLAQRHPELCAGEDDGLFAVLDKVFGDHSQRLTLLFDPHTPGISLRPSAAAIKDCFGLLSLNADTLCKYRIRIKEDENAEADVESPNPFVAPDALGWTYQYWNTEEKDRVFTKVRTVKNAKIAGADIVPATQLYTEDYMVKFLVQNSLGATWMAMHPQSRLSQDWEYYVRDADRAPAQIKPVREITFLDPACGSGHFLIEAFDLFYSMYEEERELTKPEDICTAILTHNLFGIDIDERAVQIAETALWMKAAERVFDFEGAPRKLLATNIRLPRGTNHVQAFLEKHPEDYPLRYALAAIFSGLAHADELGSLLKVEEIIKAELAAMRENDPLFAASQASEGWLARVQERLRDHFEAEAESSDLGESFFGRSAGKGFKLFDLLSQRYDVVAANPPYMGSKNMGPTLKTYLGQFLKPGKRDLYSAFLARAMMLCASSGRLAFVTLDGWCFKKQFAPLRDAVIHNSRLEAVVFLGRHAFSDADPPGLPVFTVTCNQPATDTSSIWSARFVAPRDADDQAALLADCVRSGGGLTHRTRQYSLQQIPGAGFFTWLPQEVLDRVATDTRLGTLAECLAGLQTGDAPRFVRFHWECADFTRWLKFASGGGISRWAGLEWSVVDWRANGQIIRDFPKSCWRGTQRFGETGFTYSESARGKLAFREMSKSGFSQSGSAYFPRDGIDGYSLMGILSGRYASFCSRFLRPGRAFPVGYLALIPIPTGYESLRRDVMKALGAKKWIVSHDPIEHSFEPTTILPNRQTHREAIHSHRICYYAACTLLHIVEGVIERSVFSQLNLADSSVRAITSETGIPSGWLPYLGTPPSIIPLPVQLLTLDATIEFNSQVSTPNAGDSETIERFRDRLCTFYRNGPLHQSDEEADVEGVMEVSDAESDEGTDEEDDDTGVSVPIPPETFIEELSQRIGLNPLSIFELLKTGIQTNGWRCLAEEQRELENVLTVLVLRLFGHRWPKQIEAGESAAEWVDLDGIVSLISLPNESTLYEHIQRRLIADEIRVGDFMEVVGKPLDSWLTTEFFKHHTQQFKKRPIAWQIQSGNFTARRTPAIAFLVYYHKLDGDLLRKIRKRAEDLRKSRDTELRGIQSVAPSARSDRQETRRVELEDAVEELQRFDTILDAIATSGFGPDSFLPSLRQFAIEDASLALKARWLRRLSELITKAPFRDWLKAASQADLHINFGSWISDAISHLDYTCAQVGLKPLDQKKFSSDPTSIELGALISKEAESMMTGSLSLACQVWWRRLDEEVLVPLKEQIKQLKTDQKQYEETLKSDPELPISESRELKARIKEIKADVKELNAELTEKTGRAQAVRKLIEEWRSDEPLRWGKWLSEQPLFDQISSLDHRRPAPTTIAEFIAQESLYAPNINDGVRVNIAPLQKAGLLADDVLASKDLDKAIADRAEWRADERRWVREGKLPQPGWWPEAAEGGKQP